MEVKFGTNGGEQPVPVIEVQATVTPTETLPAVIPAAVLNIPARVEAPSGLVLGDKLPDFKDIILPRINITQNIGDMKALFGSGRIVFGQNAVLYTPQEVDPRTKLVTTPASPPVKMIILGFNPTRFVEKIEGGDRGMIVATEADVLKNGGTLDYAEWNLKKAAGMRLFQQLAEAVVLVQRPEAMADDDSVFAWPADGVKWALGLWAMKGTSYTAAAKRVFFTNRKLGYLIKGYPTRLFAVSTFEESYRNGNKAWVPVCSPIGQTSPAMMEFVAQVLNPS